MVSQAGQDMYDIIDCPCIFMIHQLWNDQCTWPWDCLLSELRGFCEGDTRNRWRDGQVCPDVDKELWRLCMNRRLRCVLALDKCVQMWTRNYGALDQTARVCFGVGQVCPDVDKELWRLGQTARCVLACYAPIRRRRRSRGDFGDLQNKKGVRASCEHTWCLKVFFLRREGKEEETRKERSGRKRQEESGERTDRRREERWKREGGDGKRLKESRGDRVKPP
ncbi:hypothetical protein TNCV_926781 [Trichonephila clavipes]|nr:hypothetical protein TNCV_926781 [Trichonephila clavipes]